MQGMLVAIPAAAFQAIIRHITAADVANLRMISSAVCKRTSQHAPYVCLRLSPSSSPQYPEAWCQATQQLQHVQVVHINITGIITLQVFEAALLSLSKHRQVTALHLLGVRSAHSNECTGNVLLSMSYRGCIPSLQPIVHLKATLKTLVITDLEMENFASDLQQLSKEPAGTFQLQTLTVTAGWHCRKHGYKLTRLELCTALLLLARSFPRLQQLSLRVPTCFALWSRLDAAFPGLHAADIPYKQLQATSVMVGIGRAVSRLRHLQSLSITELPDPWAGQEIGPVAAAMAAAAFTVKSASRSSSRIKGAAKLELDFLRSMPFASAAAACSTMDSVGCWLLKQHHMLMHLHLGCGKWSMSWDKSKQQLPRRDHTTPTDSNLPVLAAARATANMMAMQAEHSCRGEEPSSAADNSSNNDSNILLDDFTRHLSHYSSRPADTLLGLITCCKLELCSNHVEDNRLMVLLQSMTSLTELEVALSNYGELANAPVAAVVTAAASVTGLKCLKLRMYEGLLTVTHNLLLPLTAAAGGPKGLEKLHLTAPFAAESSDHDDGVGWLTVSQLTCLKELSIEQVNLSTRLRFPVNSLPASLESFRGQWLVLHSQIPVAAAAAAELDSIVTILPSDGSATQQAEKTSMCVITESSELRVLHIQYSELTDPSILANKQLEVLIAGNGNWQGGWSAAATAWPAVKKLVCSVAPYEPNSECGDLDQPIKSICHGFSGLKSLMVNPMPCLTTEMAQMLVQQVKHLQHVSMVLPGQQAAGRIGEKTPTESDVEQHRLLQQQLPWATVELGPPRISYVWEGY